MSGIELNLGAAAPPAAVPNPAALATLFAARCNAGQQPAPKLVQPTPQMQEESPAETPEMTDTKTDTQNTTDATLEQALGAIDVPAATQDTTLPEEAGIVAVSPTADREPLPRGSGTVDYREGGNGKVYATATDADKNATDEETQVGIQVVTVCVPHTETLPNLGADGVQKVSKSGKPMFKKVSVEGTRYVKLSEAAVTGLTDDAASAVMHHIIHAVDGHLATQGVSMPAEGALTDDWILTHFGVNSISDVIASLLTPWTLTGKGGKIATVQREALLCNLPVDGINPSQFITNAHTHLSDVFKSQYIAMYNKEPTATLVKQAGDVTLKLLAAYERHDAAMEKYADYEIEVAAAKQPVLNCPKLSVSLAGKLHCSK